MNEDIEIMMRKVLKKREKQLKETVFTIIMQDYYKPTTKNLNNKKEER